MRVAFSGDTTYAASADESEAFFTIRKQTTTITLSPDPLEFVVGDVGEIAAALVDGADRPQLEQTILFELSGDGGTARRAVITNYLGEAVLNVEGLANALPAGVYTLRASFAGNDTHLPSATTGTVTVVANQPPVCSEAYGVPDHLWPLKKNFQLVQVLGVTDPDGDPITLHYDGIYQDEPIGTGSHSPDGQITDEGAFVRAERDGNGDGRVYHLYFTASDGRGGQCTGIVRIPTVPHDQGGGSVDAIDGGPCYNSLTGEPGPACLSGASAGGGVFLPYVGSQ